ncbi:MAG: cobalt-precorrin 5A hydrolase [Lachnospiraceae bacterium]
MKTGILSFTVGGRALALQLEKLLLSQRQVELCQGKEVKDWCVTHFATVDEIIFIGAAGIAVRMIAPLIQNKRKDPAVVVLDEKGQWVISLLSGHLGGANELARSIAGKIGASAVITTATDVNHVFAADLFAQKNNLKIMNFQLVKAVSQSLVNGKQVGFYCENPITGELPGELFWMEKNSGGKEPWICITMENSRIQEKELRLVPQAIVLGFGCRKGSSRKDIETEIFLYLDKYKLALEAVCGIASINLKKDEPGIVEFCQQQKIPVVTYSAEQLQQVEGDFSTSEFVKKITGVDNVCERAALLLGNGGYLAGKKQGGNGITLAHVRKDWSVEFE